MFRYLERLRRKPLAERRRIAVSATILSVAVIAAVWAAFTVFRLGAPDGPAIAPATETPESATGGIRGPYD